MFKKIRKKIREYLFKQISLTEADVLDFQKRFPGKCMMCSYQRFGYQMGYLPDNDPPTHVCIEKKEVM